MFDVTAFGPFIGDWKTEVFIFRPFIKWVSEIINIDNIYISSHINRFFLYDWLDKENFIPVYENISRNELLQNGFLHKEYTKTDYNLLFKVYRNDVLKRVDKYVNFFQINYTKIFSYPFYCRLYMKINIDRDIKNDGGYCLYIPDNIENSNVCESVYFMLLKEFKDNVLVCGDMKTHLNDYNTVLFKKDYFQYGYEYILSYINNAKAVICPMGFWTFLSNLQNKPVYSWVTKKGNTSYRNMLQGKKYNIVQTNEPKMIFDGFKNFLKNVKE